MTGLARSLALLIAVAAAGIAAGWFAFEATPLARGGGENPAAAEFRQACIAQAAREGPDQPRVFHRAYCACYAEEAVENLPPYDLRIGIAAFSGEVEAVVEAIEVMPPEEQIAYSKRTRRFMARMGPHCAKVGFDALEAAAQAN